MSNKNPRTHYAQRVFRSVHHLGETIWQPLCGISNVSKIRLSTYLPEVTCRSCRNILVRNRVRFGLSRRINKILREGIWRETENE